MNQVIVLGLGNFGQQYQFSRHNVGFMLLDKILPEVGEWKTRTNPAYKVVTLQLDKLELQLVKPATFMNQSGLVAQKIRKHNPQLALENWYVVHDDLDIELGQYKIQMGRGPKVHNGLLSIYSQLQTNDFWHVRVGVDGRAGKRVLSGSDYVLQPFPPGEKIILNGVLDKAKSELLNRWKS